MFVFYLRSRRTADTYQLEGGSLRGDERANRHVLALAEDASDPSQTNKSFILVFASQTPALRSQHRKLNLHVVSLRLGLLSYLTERQA